MADVRFTRRCFNEDLQRLPKWAQKEAIAAAESIATNPEMGLPLEPPLDRFRRIRLRNVYRLVYGYDSESDTWWIYLIGKRQPGKERDVYQMLKDITGRSGSAV
ncbi:MAG: type II toxin-antitoxin system RelE family toxin [bacterium]